MTVDRIGNQFYVDGDNLDEEALARKHRLENDPAQRTDPMQYMEGMERISSDIMARVLARMDSYDYDTYTDTDVRRALLHETCTVDDFQALLSPAALPYLQNMRQAGILAIPSICLRHCILPITVRITAYIADLTAIMISRAKSFRSKKSSVRCR